MECKKSIWPESADARPLGRLGTPSSPESPGLAYTSPLQEHLAPRRPPVLAPLAPAVAPLRPLTGRLPTLSSGSGLCCLAWRHGLTVHLDPYFESQHLA